MSHPKGSTIFRWGRWDTATTHTVTGSVHLQPVHFVHARLCIPGCSLLGIPDAPFYTIGLEVFHERLSFYFDGELIKHVENSNFPTSSSFDRNEVSITLGPCICEQCGGVGPCSAWGNTIGTPNVSGHSVHEIESRLVHPTFLLTSPDLTRIQSL
jgi:hypothetical protein